MKKSEVKTCTGNGSLDVWGLVIVYGAWGLLCHLLIKQACGYQTHVIEVVKHMCENLMISFCEVFGYRWQFVTETTSIL